MADIAAVSARTPPRTVSATIGLAPRLTALALPSAIGVIAAAGGGYFPTAWGWGALFLFWVAALASLLRAEIRVSVLEWGAAIAVGGVAAWTGLSTFWSADVTQTVLELQRSLVYVAAVLAIAVVARKRVYRDLLGGLLLALTAVSAYGLATRLFPERFGVYDPVATYRLAEPVGYWNALGILTAIALLLALGFAARSDGYVTRGLAGAALVVLVATLYFTFARGPWIALASGLVVAIALDSRRLQLITALVVFLPVLAATVWLASNSTALTRQGAPLRDASREGHRLALAIVLLSAAAALLSLALRVAEKRLPISRHLRVGYAVGLGIVVAAVLVGVFARFGGPVSLASDAYDEFKGPPVGITQPGSDLNRRLLSLSGNGRFDLWSAAWDNFEAHPWVGSGAGTYEQYWLQHRPLPLKVRDAHSLYAETLAELGLVGLALLLLAFAIPLLGIRRARHARLGAVASGAYVAFVAHAGVDWDWEIPAVVLGGLMCGMTILVAARTGRERPVTPRLRAGFLGASVALAAVAFVGLVGNIAMSASADAVADSDWSRAASEARKARRWAPWSSQPWQLLGQAGLAQQDRPAARRAFLKAIEKDPKNWELWFGLAGASEGTAQLDAFRRAWTLNPFTRGPLEDEDKG